jgi:anti-sigma-K factor RskA
MEPAEYQPLPPEVHDYVDGRLSADAERDFERRMNASAQLRTQVEQLRQAIEMLRDLPAREPRPGFAERVVGRIREEDLAERARQRIVAAPVPLWTNAVQVAIGAIAASLVLAVIGMPGLWERTQPDIPGVGGENVAMAPTESDLLPALGDHSERL